MFPLYPRHALPILIRSRHCHISHASPHPSLLGVLILPTTTWWRSPSVPSDMGPVLPTAPRRRQDAPPANSSRYYGRGRRPPARCCRDRCYSHGSLEIASVLRFEGRGVRFRLASKWSVQYSPLVLLLQKPRKCVSVSEEPGTEDERKEIGTHRKCSMAHPSNYSILAIPFCGLAFNIVGS